MYKQILIVALLSLVLASGCKDEENMETSVEGYVLDITTGVGIAGAKV